MEKHGPKERKTTLSPGQEKDYFLFLGACDMDAPYRPGWTSWSWYLLIPPGQLSIVFVDVGGWLTFGDLAMDSCAQFLAIAEHRLIPSGARSVCHQLRKAGHHSIWAPACQDQVAGGHARVGVVSLGGAPLALPTFATSEFQEFFRLDKTLQATLPTGNGRVVHLFIIYGYQGAEEDPKKLQLTDKLLQSFLAEAQVVCTGQPVLIASDLIADPSCCHPLFG